MIERYSLDRMKNVWSRENKFKKWLKVELAVCKAYYNKKMIPEIDYLDIVEKADFDIERIDSIEKEIKHDVIAFLTSLSEHIGPSSRYVHMGLTSSDVIDTANALLLKEALDILINDIKQLKEIVIDRAKEYKLTPIMGRSHGVHAEPTTVGLKMLVWFDDLDRTEYMFEDLKKNILRGKISGPVGNYSNIMPEIEELTMKELGLKPARISSQIISRDIYADFIYIISRAAAIMEKMALNIRLLQRTETREFEEPFTIGQKGSSAMPHKRNPILCERICGLARILRGNLMPALENIALWDERDISHSSAERIILPDSSILLDYMFEKMSFIVNNMKIYEDNINKNLKLSYNLFFSQKVLLALVNKGITREDAYKMVQNIAMQSWKDKLDFKELVLQSNEINQYLSTEEIKNIFDLNVFMNKAELIFKRFENEE